ncbi:MAG: RsmD family RNA methyltransferase [Pseudomonadota bacterium]
MKVISGWAKNLPLLAPSGLQTRPTRTRVREAVLSILQFDLKDKIAIDAFAGSGAMGLEMLSRGAKGCLFAENNAEARAILAKNIKALKGRAQSAGMGELDIATFEGDLMAGSWVWPQTYQNPDILWVDPPYDLAPLWLSQFLSRPGLYPKLGGLAIVEHRTADTGQIQELFQKCQAFKLKNLKKYGETSIIFMERVY